MAERCEEQPVCSAGYHVANPKPADPTAVGGWNSSVKRICEPCSESYTTAPNLPACTDYSTCKPGQFISMRGSPVSDQSCSQCTTGQSFSNKTNAPYCMPQPACAGVLGKLLGSSCTSLTCATSKCKDLCLTKEWTCDSGPPKPKPSTKGSSATVPVVLTMLLLASVGGTWYYYRRKISRARVVLHKGEDGEVEGVVDFSGNYESGLSISADDRIEFDEEDTAGLVSNA